MGSRKQISAEQRKEARKTLYVARLRNVPTSPRKMRIVADLIRGMNVENAMSVLQHTSKEAAGRLYKLLRSAIANWEVKNEGKRVEDNQLYVKEISVDGGRMLKRIQPAPQGRAHRIRKRSNHVTLILGNKMQMKEEVEEVITDNTDK
ncbi:MAG: 50S ribosomal protein L22 [Bacteroidetes bacterium]|nr:50S ribosomal protein L22 [Bacteroidota bacterium]MBL6943502.1 50S ribosomal protein L22 [Bacteroidales bacterium]